MEIWKLQDTYTNEILEKKLKLAKKVAHQYLPNNRARLL